MKTIFLAVTLFLGLQASADPPATHGMLLFGHKNTYVSHLPMFHAPHNYQVILKIQMTSPQNEVLLKYERLNSQSETLFTIEPEPMDLSQVIAGKITSFHATLYKGHFERGGEALGLVKIAVQKQIVAKKLDPSFPETNQYLIFGEGGEYFSAHSIGGSPNHDSLFEVTAPSRIVVQHCRAIDCPGSSVESISDDRLPVSISFQSDAIPAVGTFLGSFFDPATVKIEKMIYSETGDLSH